MAREVARRVDRADDAEAKLAAISALLVYEEHADRTGETGYIGRYMETIQRCAGDLVISGPQPLSGRQSQSGLPATDATASRPAAGKDECVELVRGFYKKVREDHPATRQVADRSLFWLLAAATKPVFETNGHYELAVNAVATKMALQLIEPDPVIGVDDHSILVPVVGPAVMYAISEGLTLDILRIAASQMTHEL